MHKSWVGSTERTGLHKKQISLSYGWGVEEMCGVWTMDDE